MQDFPWRKLYTTAILELDRKQLETKIAAAHAALQSRVEELNLIGDQNGDSVEERRAITDALHNLRSLQWLCSAKRRGRD